jgi:hypothetical protein
MRPPETSANSVHSTLRALEEFAPEQIDPPAPTNGSADAVSFFNRAATRHRPLTVAGSLLAIAPARISEARVEPFSRIEETEAKRRRRRASQFKTLMATLVVTSNSLKNAGHTLRSGAQRASIAVDTSMSRIGTRKIRSAALVTGRASGVAHHGRCAVRRLAATMRERSAASQARMHAERETIVNGTQHGVRVVGQALTRFISRSAEADRVSKRAVPVAREGGDAAGHSAVGTRPASHALQHQKLNGTFVASVLAIAIIGYGGFLATFWQAGATETVTEAPVISSVTAPAAPTGESGAVGAPLETGGAVAQPSATDAAPVAIMPSARTLAAIWARLDTRTLDRAFAALRQETLAFRTCGMRVTDVHRAVARCEGVVPARSGGGLPPSRPVEWTIEFQRTDGRWLIADVTTR